MFPYENLIFYLSLLLLAATVGAFFLFSHLNQQTNQEIATLIETLNKQKSDEEKNLENEFLKNRQRLQDFPVLLSEHTINTQFFQRLEAQTIPNIIYDQLKFNPAERTVNLTGRTDSFESLGQQLIIFTEDQDFIEQANLTKVSYNNEGTIDFAFSILVNPKVVKYSETQ